MDNLSLQILLVEDNLTDVLLLRDALDQVPTITFVLTHVERLDAGLKSLEARRFDAVLLDLGLPDSQGLETLNRMQSLHPDVPIMVLSGLDDENIAVRAVQNGAQDYLVKGKINGTMVALTIRYAIERKRSEQRLLTAEAGYRRLFETAQDGIFLLNADTGQITDANPSLEKLLGYTLAEFVGKRLWEIAPFRDRAANVAAFRTLQEKGFIRYEDLPLAAKDGRFIPVEFVSNVYTVGDKRVIQCNIRDITDRKRAEAAERDAQRFKQSTLDALGAHIAVLDEDGTVIATNNAWRQFWDENGGTPGSWGMGTNYLGVCDGATGPQSDEARLFAQGIRQVMTGQQSVFSMEYPCHSPREERWFNLYVTRFAGDGPRRVVVAHENITARKQAEADVEKIRRQYELLFNSVGEGIQGVDMQGKITFENPTALKLLSGEARDLIGQPAHETIHHTKPDGTVYPKSECPIYTTLRDGVARRVDNEVFWRQDGTSFPVEYSSTPIHNEQGEIDGVVVAFRDITERKQAEAALERSEREQRELAQQLEKEKSRLVEAQAVAKVGSWELDLSTNVLNWSEENHRIFGIDRSQFGATYEAFLERIHPDDRAMVDKAYTDSVTHRTAYAIDHRLQTEDGSVKFVHERGNTFYDDAGRPVRSVGTTQDITERKQAEEAVAAKSREIVTIWESMTDAFFHLDTEWRFTHINPQTALLVQKSRDELIGVNIWDAFPQSVNTTVAYREYHRAMREQVAVSFEDFSPRLEKSFEVHAYPSSTGLSVYFRDITERKQAEERIRYLTTSAKCLLWSADVFESVDGNSGWTFTYIDEEAAQRFLPMPVPDGMPYMTAVNRSREPGDRERMNQYGWEHVRRGEDYTQESRLQGLDGQWYWQREDVRVETIAPGKWRLVGVAIDITSQKDAEAQLIFQKTLLEAQSEAAPDGILAVSDDGHVLSYNQRYVQMWDIPAEVVASGDKAQFRQAVLNRVVNPQQVWERAQYLYTHRDERSSEELLLLDGRVFTRDSAPITSTSGAYYGRVWYFRDITERKKAETLLRESRERLTLATESAHIGIWDWDVVTNQMVWDAQMFALYGIRMDDFSGAYDTWEKGLHPEDRDRAEAELNVALNGDRDFHTEFRVVWPTGEVRHIEAHALVQRAHDGSALRMTGVNWDITERRQAEASLRRSEERYRSLALATTQIVWIADANGVIEDMPAWREFTGQRMDEVRGWDWMEAMHPEDREPTLKIWARSVETRSFYETEYRVRSASGEYRLFAVRGVPVLETDGSVREWVGTCTDIHDIRKAEEELDRFFTLSLDMLAIIGSDGYMKRLNPAFEATLGFSPAEMMAVPFMEFVHPDDHLATQAETAKLASGALVIQFENRYRCRDGSYRWLRWMCAPYEELFYCVAHDITGVMEIAVALQQANNDLERRVEERTGELAQINSALLGQISERERAEAEMRARANQQEAVAELGQRALADIDMDSLLHGATSLVRAILNVEISTILELMPDDKTMRFRVANGWKTDITGYLVPNYRETQAGYALLNHAPTVFSDLSTETRFKPSKLLLGQGVVSGITVVMGSDEKPFGILGAYTTRPRRFSQNEIHFLQAVSNVLATALERKQAEAENIRLNLHLQGANDELRANEARLLQGNQISTDLMRLRVRTHEELQEALHQITEAASMMLNIERSSVWIFNEDGTIIHCHDLYERSLNRHSSGYELVEDANYFPAIKAQREVVAEDARTNPATAAYWESYLEPNGIASILDVALVVGGKHLGVLCCEHVGEPRQWEAEDRTFASAIASVCSLVLESYERACVEIDLQAAKVEAERATAEANAANHAKSEFLSRMSHELRTPLNAILGFGQILDKQDLGPLSKESVSYILKGGRHLLDLINEVLDIARVEAGHLDLSVEPIPLDDIVVEACAMMWPLATERSIWLEENTRARGHKNMLHVMADRQRLKQVLINLLSNAIKYNHEGGQVEVVCAQKPDGWITIAVRDTGPGIAPEDLPKLFTPFERLRASDSQIEGTGLGLVLSQRLMTAMGGTLEVESVLGQGTTFTIALPEAVSPEVRVASSPEAARPFDTRSEGEHTYTVLCMEDNLSNLRLMEVLFQGRPEITLLVAMQASVGLDMARQHEPDLILLDLNLPDIHGKDVLARLQQSALTRDIPVVVISADATPNQVERLLALGAKAYLTKPLDVGQFLRTLDTFLQPARTGDAKITPDEETA